MVSEAPKDSRAKLGIRIGALVAAVSGIVIYISTGRPTGSDGAASSEPAANVPPLEAPGAVNPAGNGAPETAPPGSLAPSPSGSATPPALSAVVPAAGR
jgi:hypothetical protein